MSRSTGLEDGSAQPTIGPLRDLSEYYRRSLAAFLLKTLPAGPPDPAGFRVVISGGSQHLLSSRMTRQALNRAFELRAIAADLERREPGPPTSGRRVLDEERTPFNVAAAATRKALGITADEQRVWNAPNKALNAWRRALERRGILVFAMNMPTGDCAQHRRHRARPHLHAVPRVRPRAHGYWRNLFAIPGHRSALASRSGL